MCKTPQTSTRDSQDLFSRASEKTQALLLSVKEEFPHRTSISSSRHRGFAAWGRANSVLSMKDREMSVGWKIFTWELFAVQIFTVCSESIGVYQIGFTKQTLAILWFIAVTIQCILMLVTIHLCMFYRSRFDELSVVPETSHVFVPLFMGFFATLYRMFWVATAIAFVRGGSDWLRQENSTLYEHFHVKPFFIFVIIETIVEIATAYFIFNLVFLR